MQLEPLAQRPEQISVSSRVKTAPAPPSSPSSCSLGLFCFAASPRAAPAQSLEAEPWASQRKGLPKGLQKLWPGERFLPSLSKSSADIPPPWCSCCFQGSVALQPRGKRCSGAIPVQQILLCSTWGLSLLGAESPSRGTEVCSVPAVQPTAGWMLLQQGRKQGTDSREKGGSPVSAGFCK